MFYNIELTKDAKVDLDNISKYLEEYGVNNKKVIEKINMDIINLRFMPRTHKTLLSYENPDGEYRRLVSGRYIIIYQIKENQINILRVFSEKQNYLKLKGFILKEEPEKYIVKKGEKLIC